MVQDSPGTTEPTSILQIYKPIKVYRPITLKISNLTYWLFLAFCNWVFVLGELACDTLLYLAAAGLLYYIIIDYDRGAIRIKELSNRSLIRETLAM